MERIVAQLVRVRLAKEPEGALDGARDRNWITVAGPSRLPGSPDRDDRTECEGDGRGDWIRTSDLSVPNRALYQAEPRPETWPDPWDPSDAGSGRPAARGGAEDAACTTRNRRSSLPYFRHAD